MSDVTVFACNRGGAKPDTVKVQLELPKAVVDRIKVIAEGTGRTPKRLMEAAVEKYASVQTFTRRQVWKGNGDEWS